jgi:hypothetical protein
VWGDENHTQACRFNLPGFLPYDLKNGAMGIAGRVFEQEVQLNRKQN